MGISPIHLLRQNPTNPASLRDPHPGARSPLDSFPTLQNSDELCIQPSLRYVSIASVMESVVRPGNASGRDGEGSERELSEEELGQCVGMVC